MALSMLRPRRPAKSTGIGSTDRDHAPCPTRRRPPDVVLPRRRPPATSTARATAWWSTARRRRRVASPSSAGPFTHYEPHGHGRPSAATGPDGDRRRHRDHRLPARRPGVGRSCSPGRCGGALRRRPTTGSAGRGGCRPTSSTPGPRPRCRCCACSPSLAGYLGTLLTQTNTFFKEEFGVTDGQIGTMLAAVRVGALLALRGRGRRPTGGAGGGCCCGRPSPAAWSPRPARWPRTWPWLGVSQTIARAFSTALVAGHQHHRGRGDARRVAGLRGVGAERHRRRSAPACRVMMLVTVAGLGPVGLADPVPRARWPRVPVVRAARPPHPRDPAVHRVGRPAEVRDPRAGVAAPAATARGIDRGRLVLLSASGLALSLFVLPASSFLNEYLRTERGFSAGAIIVFQIATNTPGRPRHRGRRQAGRPAGSPPHRRGRRGRRRRLHRGHVPGRRLVDLGVLAPRRRCSGPWPSPPWASTDPSCSPPRPAARPTASSTWPSVVGSAVGLVAGRRAVGPARRARPGHGGAVHRRRRRGAAWCSSCYPETASLELEDLNPDDAPLARELFAFEGLDPEFQVDRYPARHRGRPELAACPDRNARARATPMSGAPAPVASSPVPRHDHPSTIAPSRVVAVAAARRRLLLAAGCGTKDRPTLAADATDADAPARSASTPPAAGPQAALQRARTPARAWSPRAATEGQLAIYDQPGRHHPGHRR